MKNLHLQHPEDSVLTGNLSILDWFQKESYVSVKMDGCPAIVWGKDPATDTFFVGTKAVFNKKKIRIAHSHDEIDVHYEGEVRNILHDCFDCLPRTDQIIQGDFIGYGGDDTYKPNSIKYVFPKIVCQSIIVAPHTIYTADNDLRDAVASYLVKSPESTMEVLFVKPDAWCEDDSFKDIVEFARQMSQLCEFVSDKKARQVEKVINTFIRVSSELDPEALAAAADCDVNLMRFWKLIWTIKMDKLSICANDGPFAYLGKKYIAAEGYVLSNEHGSYKLVDRQQFSQYNFNYGRFANCLN